MGHSKIALENRLGLSILSGIKGLSARSFVPFTLNKHFASISLNLLWSNPIFLCMCAVPGCVLNYYLNFHRYKLPKY